MDSDSEVVRAKWLLAGFVVFLIGSWFSYRELIYLVRGREGPAVIARAYEVEKRGRWGLVTGTRVAVDFEFLDSEGNRRKGHDEMSSGWQPPRDGPVRVQYTPGADGSSRLAGHVNWFGPAVFAVALVYLVIMARRLLRRASRAVSEGKR
jgi:hypothetical protein